MSPRYLLILPLSLLFILPVYAFYTGEDQAPRATISYPFDGALFPADMAPPSVLIDYPCHKTNTKTLTLIQGNIEHRETITTKRYRIPATVWGQLKPGEIISISVYNEKGQEEDKISVRISPDSVAAPIFYRDVPLPFSWVKNRPEAVKWRIVDPTSTVQSHVVLEKVGACMNCHSFSANGEVFGSEVNHTDDRGAYLIKEVEEKMTLKDADVMSWSSFDPDSQSMGMLTSLSPDGRYAISPVKDHGLLMLTSHPNYSFILAPMEGMLAWYDRAEQKFGALPGADDPAYVYANPTWSHDGQTILCCRSRVINEADVGLSPWHRPIREGGYKIKYDLYTIPFNQGRGGQAEALEGASHNGMSNYCARMSPDGRWIVFTQSDGFIMMQQGSRLVMVPSAGGQARVLDCNMGEFNSWHSWSPNGKWLVFVSKAFGPYTQLFLSHIDEKGMDSPPVWIENALPPERAANLPEFVNKPPGYTFSMVQDFSQVHHYFGHGHAYYPAVDMDSLVLHYDPSDIPDPDADIREKIEEQDPVEMTVKRGLMMLQYQDTAQACFFLQQAASAGHDSARVYMNKLCK